MMWLCCTEWSAIADLDCSLTDCFRVCLVKFPLLEASLAVTFLCSLNRVSNRHPVSPISVGTRNFIHMQSVVLNGSFLSLGCTNSFLSVRTAVAVSFSTYGLIKSPFISVFLTKAPSRGQHRRKLSCIDQDGRNCQVSKSSLVLSRRMLISLKKIKPDESLQLSTCFNRAYVLSCICHRVTYIFLHKIEEMSFYSLEQELNEHLA